jgi:hypothetical protein
MDTCPQWISTSPQQPVSAFSVFTYLARFEQRNSWMNYPLRKTRTFFMRKKDENTCKAPWDIMLSEVSQAQKDKGCMFSLIHGR